MPKGRYEEAWSFLQEAGNWRRWVRKKEECGQRTTCLLERDRPLAAQGWISTPRWRLKLWSYTYCWRWTQSLANPSLEKIPCISEIYRENRIRYAFIHRRVSRKGLSRMAFDGSHETHGFVRTGNNSHWGGIINGWESTEGTRRDPLEHGPDLPPVVAPAAMWVRCIAAWWFLVRAVDSPVPCADESDYRFVASLPRVPSPPRVYQTALDPTVHHVTSRWNSRIAVLPRAARRDKQCLHANSGQPVSHGLDRELWSITRANVLLGGRLAGQRVPPADTARHPRTLSLPPLDAAPPYSMFCG